MVYVMMQSVHAEIWLFYVRYQIFFLFSGGRMQEKAGDIYIYLGKVVDRRERAHAAIGKLSFASCGNVLSLFCQPSLFTYNLNSFISCIFTSSSILNY